MKFTRKAHQLVWTELERKWGARLGLIIQGLKAQRAMTRLEGWGVTDRDVLQDVLRLIPVPRTRSKPIKESMRQLEKLQQYVPEIVPKRWAGELVELHQCKVFYTRMQHRDQWKVCTKRLVFDEARVSHRGRKVSVYVYTAERIKERLQRNCPALTDYVWWGATGCV